MNILITGASRGIGFETAKLLAVRGHAVLAIARDDKALEHLRNETEKLKHGAKIHTSVFDLSSGNISAFVEHTVRPLFPRLDVLINNAGSLINKPFEKISRTELEGIYRVNVFSVFELVQSLLPLFTSGVSLSTTSSVEVTGERIGERLSQKRVGVQAQGAHILNISSIGGITGTSKFPGLSAYSSSKGALSILTECLALELKEKNIAVNALALGAVQTEMLYKAFPNYKAPLSAKQMAEYIADFAVSGQKYFNGKVLPVSLSTP